MINSEYKLTVDDLIVEYMIYKVKNGYETNFLASEFLSFLDFFKSKMKVKDSLYEKENLFERFYERKCQSSWSIIKDYTTFQQEVIPHMDMIYIDKGNDCLLKANYRLSEYDRSVINTYFMAEEKQIKIKKIIGEYLSNKPKRKLDESIKLSNNYLQVGKYAAAQIITNIWNTYINEKVEYDVWPKQCKDINKYLFEIDLAKIIEVKSIKNELMALYNVLSKRIAILYSQDKSLKISSYKTSYLARANYEIISHNYEKMFRETYGFKKEIPIDIAVFKYDNDYEINTNDSDKNMFNKDKIKKLVINLDRK